MCTACKSAVLKIIIYITCISMLLNIMGKGENNNCHDPTKQPSSLHLFAFRDISFGKLICQPKFFIQAMFKQ